jgi:hypothetical protein
MTKLTPKVVGKPVKRDSKAINLKSEQEKTLKTPVMGANLILKALFRGMDLIYGSKRTLLKFRVIEILARYPYWAWEISSYNRLTRMYASTSYNKKDSSDEAIHYIELGRRSQDNEQWHMMIIEEIMLQKGIEQGWFKTFLIPRVLSLGYLGLTRLMFRLKPEWSFAMNAKFESHAEHEYMRFVNEHPEWEDESVQSEYFQYYPKQATMADLFRRIGLDEREHMEDSMAEYQRLTGKALS